MYHTIHQCPEPFELLRIASSLLLITCRVVVVMQARHGKRKRLEETLNTGFEINAEDAMGNTLLLVAVQQLQVGTNHGYVLNIVSYCVPVRASR